MLVRIFTCLLVLATFAGMPGFAQDFRGTITGQITDASGAGVPDAKGHG
jgi:hypothetical protein